MAVTELDLAHLRHGRRSIIIIPLDSSLEYRPYFYKLKVRRLLQIAANNAGLAGDVAIVWPLPWGFGLYAPPIWHPFLLDISYEDIIFNINTVLRIDLDALLRSIS